MNVDGREFTGQSPGFFTRLNTEANVYVGK